jgi:hypothetical protein
VGAATNMALVYERAMILGLFCCCFVFLVYGCGWCQQWSKAKE